MSERGARHAARRGCGGLNGGLMGGWAEVAKMARQFEVSLRSGTVKGPPTCSDRGPYMYLSMANPCLSGKCVLRVPGRQVSKWSGEWQTSKNFGACGASGKSDEWQ